MIFNGEPEGLEVAALPGLNARAIAVLCGPGGGKTVTLAEFHRARLRVVSFDPAGELARRVESFPDVQVWEVPDDWEQRSGLLPELVKVVREGHKVCLDLSEIYATVPAFVEAATKALVKARPRDVLLVMEECQRYVGQNRAETSPSVKAALEMGRNWRWGRIVATQRPASVDKEVLARCDTLLLGRISDSTDMDAVEARLRLNVPGAAERDAVLRGLVNLPAGSFLLREPAHPPGVNS